MPTAGLSTGGFAAGGGGCCPCLACGNSDVDEYGAPVLPALALLLPWVMLLSPPLLLIDGATGFEPRKEMCGRRPPTEGPRSLPPPPVLALLLLLPLPPPAPPLGLSICAKRSETAPLPPLPEFTALAPTSCACGFRSPLFPKRLPPPLPPPPGGGGGGTVDRGRVVLVAGFIRSWVLLVAGRMGSSTLRTFSRRRCCCCDCCWAVLSRPPPPPTGRAERGTFLPRCFVSEAGEDDVFGEGFRFGFGFAIGF